MNRNYFILFWQELLLFCEEREYNTYFRSYIDIFDISHRGGNINIRSR